MLFSVCSDKSHSASAWATSTAKGAAVASAQSL